MNAIQLKEKLQICKEQNYTITDMNSELYLNTMLTYIGDIDPVLRDKLIFSCFHHFTTNGFFTDEQLSRTLESLLTESYLFKGIHENIGDLIFRRSFSLLWIEVILSHHLESPFLNEQLIHNTKNKLFKYMLLEKDTRAFVSNKGWAHSISHLADALYILLNCTELNHSDYVQFLDTLKQMYFSFTTGLSTDEDERMVLCLYTYVQEKKIPEQSFKDWLESLKEVLKKEDRHLAFIQKNNIMHLLRSLYFFILHEKKESAFTDTLIKIDRCFSDYFE